VTGGEKGERGKEKGENMWFIPTGKFLDPPLVVIKSDSHSTWYRKVSFPFGVCVLTLPCKLQALRLNGVICAQMDWTLVYFQTASLDTYLKDALT
jgi:hypothetical protein